MPGRFGVAGLHPVAIREPFQNFVCILQLTNAAICITKGELRQADDGTDRAVRVSRLRDDRKIARGRILARYRQAIGIDEM